MSRKKWRGVFSFDPVAYYYDKLVYRALCEAPLRYHAWEMGSSKKIYRGPRGMVLALSFSPPKYNHDDDYSLALTAKGWKVKHCFKTIRPRARINWPSRPGVYFVFSDLSPMVAAVIV